MQNIYFFCLKSRATIPNSKLFKKKWLSCNAWTTMNHTMFNYCQICYIDFWILTLNKFLFGWLFAFILQQVELHWIFSFAKLCFWHLIFSETSREVLCSVPNWNLKILILVFFLKTGRSSGWNFSWYQTSWPLTSSLNQYLFLLTVTLCTRWMTVAMTIGDTGWITSKGLTLR